jgi:hypothetical protein
MIRLAGRVNDIFEWRNECHGSETKWTMGVSWTQFTPMDKTIAACQQWPSGY